MFFNKTKKLKNENIQLKLAIEDALEVKEKVIQYNNELADKLKDMLTKFPFDLGQVVYDVQLRSAKGRFTKTKPSLEHSLINEVVVDKKNYFGLVERYNNRDVFTTYEAAEKHLKAVCVE